MNIREATLEDVPRLVALNEATQNTHGEAMPERFRQDSSPEEVCAAFREALEEESSYWLVAEQDQVEAFLSSQFRLREKSWCMVAHQSCYLGGIVVSPECRRLGIARRLIETLMQEAATRGVGQLELDVWSFNHEARAAYESLGFEPIMERLRLRVSPDQQAG